MSDHEVAQGYESIVDPSVYVRLPIIGELAGLAGVDLLVWTTTPWTLVSNTTAAVHPDILYVVARTRRGTFVVAQPLLDTVLGEDAEVLASMPGSSLEGVRYRRPFDLVDIPNAHFVITADYVTAQDGTGLVHQTPAFGADDLAACRRHNLPVVNPIGPDGRFLVNVDLVGGSFFKDADPVLVADLKQRGLLFKALNYEHQYPHCWRCRTPLMYYAQLSWYIRTTAKRAELQREKDLSGLDPHRPYIDGVTFACRVCGEPASRVSEVIDAWFDSGSMPFASIGYPSVEGSVERFAEGYPAQFICEAIDQTRGWVLHAYGYRHAGVRPLIV